MIDVAHFYHCWAAGEWRDPVAEHMAALNAADFDGPFIVGLVGTSEQRAEAREEIATIRPATRWVEADTGWEQVTLAAVHEHAQEHDGMVLYAHTKGAHRPGPFQDAWRRSMTWSGVIRNWQNCARTLTETGADAIGSHWLTAQEFPAIVVDTPFPMFGGNFWLATCQYLRRLPAPANGTRHDAEAWIGLADPVVIDLLPGWPGHFPPVNFSRLVARPR